MKTRLLIAGLLIMLGTFNLQAQFVVTDPVNLAQSIVNSANEIVQTSSTVSNVRAIVWCIVSGSEPSTKWGLYP